MKTQVDKVEFTTGPFAGKTMLFEKFRGLGARVVGIFSQNQVDQIDSFCYYHKFQICNNFKK